MKILIIEDDIKIINFLKKGLEEECYVVDYSTNGDEGLYLASVHTYDLILLDMEFLINLLENLCMQHNPIK